MEIQHFRHNDIDYTKWDNCISQASNSFIYAASWYLDTVSPGWEALVAGDYEYVMPLPVKRKFGITFLAQPLLCQQLGIFSQKKTDESIVDTFVKKIPYKGYHLHLNEKNTYVKATAQPNYVLDLSKNHSEIYASCSTNTKRNIKKAGKEGISSCKNLSIDLFLDFYYSIEKQYFEIPRKTVLKLLQKGVDNHQMHIYGAFDVDKNLLSACCILQSSQRLVYLLSVSGSEGKKKSSMFLLIDQIIRQYAGADFKLDFEGSRIQGVARFYKGFNAVETPYFEIKQLRLIDKLIRTVRKCLK